MTKHNIRAAIHHRNNIIDQLAKITDDIIEDLDRKGRYLAIPDGFKSRTMSDGMPPGTSPLTTVEAAAETNLHGRQPHDDVGDAIRETFQLLHNMAELAGRLKRKIAFIDHVAAKAEGRTVSLSGPCQCCTREVAGGASDTMRAGYCESCYRAWTRDGRPHERYMWEQRRRRTLHEEAGQTTCL